MGRPAKRNLMSLVLSHENNKCHLLVPKNPQLTVFCTYDKTLHCEGIHHAYQSISSRHDHFGGGGGIKQNMNLAMN
jgi:hypothetical protein